jgi:hypothetical protein
MNLELFIPFDRFHRTLNMFKTVFIASLSVRLPIPAYLLALTFFYMSLLSLVLLAGLRTQRTRLLLAWLLFTLLTQFPEGGMVLFMAIFYWVCLKQN